MSGLTTHVLDAVRGGGAVGVGVAVRFRPAAGTAFREIARADTDGNGRASLLEPNAVAPGLYELTFDTLGFHRAAGHDPFFDEIVVRVGVAAAGTSLHVPIILSPAAYSTYLGGAPPAGAAVLPPELER